MQRNCFFLILLLGTICGCGTPADLPPLAEFKITVTKGGAPAEGCFVLVHSDSLPSKYACYGKLVGGSLSLMTYETLSGRKYRGAPVGTIKIGIQRDLNYGLEDPRAASKGFTSREESDQYAQDRGKRMEENVKYAPPSLTDPSRSPIEFEVVAGQKNELTIELDDPQWDVPVPPSL